MGPFESVWIVQWPGRLERMEEVEGEGLGREERVVERVERMEEEGRGSRGEDFRRTFFRRMLRQRQRGAKG